MQNWVLRTFENFWIFLAFVKYDIHNSENFEMQSLKLWFENFWIISILMRRENFQNFEVYNFRAVIVKLSFENLWEFLNFSFEVWYSWFWQFWNIVFEILTWEFFWPSWYSWLWQFWNAIFEILIFENFYIFFWPSWGMIFVTLKILKCSLRNSDLRIFRFFWSSWYWLWKFWNIVLRNLTSLRIFKFFWYRTRQIFAIINFEISNKYDKLNFEIFT